MSCTRIITLACLLRDLFPLEHSKMQFRVRTCKLKTVKAIWMKLHKFVKHNERRFMQKNHNSGLYILGLIPLDHLVILVNSISCVIYSIKNR